MLSFVDYDKHMSHTMARIYLDYASTTPLDEEVLKRMLPFFSGSYGNPSSMYESGRKAQYVIQKAKRDIAGIIGSEPHEIIFTGSGTESDNLAVLGVARAYKSKGKHIIVSAIEHKAVLESARQLEKEGFEVSILPVQADGKINIEECIKLIRPETILVSVMYANNEIGTIEPIRELSSSVASLKNSSGMPFLHTDACQAAGYLDINVKNLGVDLMTLNSSKIYGPKGVGLLFKKSFIVLEPTVVGGDQEFSKRAGTENIALIAGFAEALRKAHEIRTTEFERIKNLRDYFVRRLSQELPFIKFNGHPTDRLPNIVHVSVPAIEGESMLLLLDQDGIEVATGSACSAFDLKPSHVLMAIGQDADIMHGSIRFSLGRDTTAQHLDHVVNVFKKVVTHLISLSPLKI
jgi:cysteine desulfurase